MVFLKEFIIFNILTIIICVGQEETVVFLKEFIIFNILQNYYTVLFLEEFIIFNILQNYYMCRTRGNCSIFEGIHYI